MFHESARFLIKTFSVVSFGKSLQVEVRSDFVIFYADFS